MLYNPLDNSTNQRNLVRANVNNMYGKTDPVVKKTYGTFSKSEITAFNELIEKGEISDSLVSGYGPGSKALIFTKTGKEIKEKAPAILTALAIQKASIEVQLGMLQEAAGLTPTLTNTRRYDKSVTFGRYEWTLCEPKYLGEGTYDERTPQMTACNKYNTLVYVYCDILDDIDAMKIIVNNVEDIKKYDLSVSQLIALNFSSGSINKAEESILMTDPVEKYILASDAQQHFEKMGLPLN